MWLQFRSKASKSNNLTLNAWTVMRRKNFFLQKGLHAVNGLLNSQKINNAVMGLHWTVYALIKQLFLAATMVTCLVQFQSRVVKSQTLLIEVRRVFQANTSLTLVYNPVKIQLTHSPHFLPRYQSRPQMLTSTISQSESSAYNNWIVQWCNHYVAILINWYDKNALWQDYGYSLHQGVQDYDIALLAPS